MISDEETRAVLNDLLSYEMSFPSSATYESRAVELRRVSFCQVRRGKMDIRPGHRGYVAHPAELLGWISLLHTSCYRCTSGMLKGSN